jgi:uracil-DNA glycosylase
VSDFHRYLQQQKELYGDVLYLEREMMARAHAAHSVDPATKDQAESNTGSAADAWVACESLDDLHHTICECQKCPLGQTRTKFVFGVGNPHADVVVIGEAPGADEDRQGEPFVGRAGQLLNDILKAVHFSREEVYICNILKCRPPNNRDPLPSEVEQCEPYLHHQLRLIRPRIMLAVGRIAAQTLLRTQDSLTTLRAREHSYQGIPLMVTYHPAALLRNPNWKRPTWEDVQKFRARYDAIVGSE